jgi:endonuclease/exonuclease/phosphatase (EEP) superfamily protein YafD
MAVPVGRWRGVEGTTLRVMTWNVHFGSSGVDRLIRALERFQPDVVCLQEAKAYRQRRDPVPELREAFPQWHWARQGEFVVASRFPLVTSRPRPLSDRKGLRPSLAVTLQAKGTTLTVFNVHWSTAATSTNLTRNLRQPESYLKHSHQVRMKQAEGVRRLVAEARGPVLVAGDFNTPPRSQPYRRLTAALQDCFARGGWGWGYTYRSDRPILRIDYVFASPEVKVRRCFVPRIGGSDHRPVVADVVLP